MTVISRLSNCAVAFVKASIVAFAGACGVLAGLVFSTLKYVKDSVKAAWYARD